MHFGVNDSNSLFYGFQSYRPSLAATLGAKYVRCNIPWYAVETASGVYSSTYIAQIEVIRSAYLAAGVTPIWVVSDTPNWANGSTGQNGIPTSPSTFAAFMAYMTALWPGSIWELYNEPDGNVFFVPGGVPVMGSFATICSTLATAYVPIVQAAYTAMKVADPTCTVIAGVLGQIPLNTTFYNDCVSDGIVGYYDVFSIHLYYDTGFPTAYYSPLITTFQTARTTASDSKPLWVTEFGWAAAPVPYDPLAETNIVSQNNQAQRAIDMVAGMSARGDIAVLCVYELQDTAAGPPTGNAGTDGPNFYGIIDYSGNEKQAFAAIQTVLNPSVYRFSEISGARERPKVVGS